MISKPLRIKFDAPMKNVLVIIYDAVWPVATTWNRETDVSRHSMILLRTASSLVDWLTNEHQCKGGGEARRNALKRDHKSQ